MRETTSNITWFFFPAMIMGNLGTEAENSDVKGYPERWQILGNW